jgi:hypothetical protein
MLHGRIFVSFHDFDDCAVDHVAALPVDSLLQTLVCVVSSALLFLGSCGQDLHKDVVRRPLAIESDLLVGILEARLIDCLL